MDDLLQEFIAETRETLEALAGEIVAWEASPTDQARLDSIFRFVHTVKGSCGFLDLPRLARLSHAAEDVLAAVRSGTRVADRPLVSAVLAIVDRIGELTEAIANGVGLDDSGEDLLIAALDVGAAPAALAVTQHARAPTRSVRLAVDLLDRMMSGMSDMVLARNELARRLRDRDADPTLEAALDRLSLTVADMRDTVTRTRMQKVESLFSALPRLVRDISAEVGKAVVLNIEGGDVELDREMIEMIRDPLSHIIRNAIDHGIEDRATRLLAGKRETGRLTVGARQSGNQIIIEVNDDGAGIDTARLVAKARASGMSDAELAGMSEQARLDLVFRPGLTTADAVTRISGRGVGMDVVRANVEQIGGRIELDNAPGAGLRIAIYVPLTLSIISAITVGVGDQHFAIPRQAIEEILNAGGSASRLDTVGDAIIATVRDRQLPVVDLALMLGLGSGQPFKTLVIVSTSGGSYALAVDSVLDHEELVIKPASPLVMAGGIYAGKTLPDSGRPMLLLDVAGIADVAGLQFARVSRADDDEAEDAAVEALAALLFRDLDGARRLVPLSIVDRVERGDPDAVRYTAGRQRIAIDGAIVPLVGQDPVPHERFALLRLTDGSAEVAYPIHEAIEIVALTQDVQPATQPGLVAGVVLIDGDQVELLDPYWLFGMDAQPDTASAPTCLLDGDDVSWMRTFLKPVLEKAGYKVVLPGSADAAIADLVVSDDPAARHDVPIIQLRHSRNAAPGDEGSVYRYDRDGVLASLDRHRSTVRRRA